MVDNVTGTLIMSTQDPPWPIPAAKAPDSFETHHPRRAFPYRYRWPLHRGPNSYLTPVFDKLKSLQTVSTNTRHICIDRLPA